MVAVFIRVTSEYIFSQGLVTQRIGLACLAISIPLSHSRDESCFI